MYFNWYLYKTVEYTEQFCTCTVETTYISKLIEVLVDEILCWKDNFDDTVLVLTR